MVDFFDGITTFTSFCYLVILTLWFINACLILFLKWHPIQMKQKAIEKVIH